jgi:chaperone required for assembly of F1-ATPase
MVPSDVDWDTKDGHYRVRLDGRRVDVPDQKVVTLPNRIGRPVVRPHYLNGEPIVRCFMPATMT